MTCLPRIFTGHRRTLSAWLFCLSVFATASAHAQQVVLAFSDTLAPSATLDGMARTQMLISGLRRAEVPQAMFLVRAKRANRVNYARLVQLNNAGHILVNQGYSDAPMQPAKLYRHEIDLLKGDETLRDFSQYRGYFHHDYYAAGGDFTLRKKLQNFARENDFLPTYASVATFDWYLNQKYIARVNANRSVDMASLEKIYIDMVVQGLQAYQSDVIPTVGAAGIQVLLLQSNDLAAYFIAPLVETLREKGWTIVSPDRAVSYPRATRAPIAVHTPAGFIAALSGIDLLIEDTPLLNPANKQQVDALPEVIKIFP